MRIAAIGALRALTGQDFGWDVDAWREWWEGSSSSETWLLLVAKGVEDWVQR